MRLYNLNKVQARYMSVRTRVAPSPTGAPHLGTAYIAIFNLAMAKCHDGQFVLRIEDTDQLRCKESSEKTIFEALRWMGIEWDEGPDVGGRFGPYRSSERLDLYKSHIQKLIDKGSAFYCFVVQSGLTVYDVNNNGARKLLVTTDTVSPFHLIKLKRRLPLENHTWYGYVYLTMVIVFSTTVCEAMSGFHGVKSICKFCRNLTVFQRTT